MYIGESCAERPQVELDDGRSEDLLCPSAGRPQLTDDRVQHAPGLGHVVRLRPIEPCWLGSLRRRSELGQSGEAVKLFVVKKDAALTAEQVLAHCREHLTGYKCPREVEFRTELPKTNVGKILRRQLRDEQKKAA